MLALLLVFLVILLVFSPPVTHQTRVAVKSALLVVGLLYLIFGGGLARIVDMRRF